MASKFAAALTGFAALASSLNIKPCYDGHCEKCSDSKYDVTKGVPDVDYYKSFKEDGYPASNTSSGYGVWWNIDQPDDGCAIMIYEAFSQHNSSANWGNIVLQSAHAGCFYTNMNEGEWATQFCCGDGDCGAVQPGNVIYMAGSSDPGQVSRRSDSLEIRAPPKPSDGTLVQPLGSATAPLKNSTATTSTSHGDSSAKVRRTGKARRDVASNEPICDDTSLTKLYECTSDAWSPSGPTCSTKSSTTYQKAGEQQQVSSALRCNVGADCTLSHLESLMLTETLTSDHSVTSTSSNGIQVSVNAGFSFGQQGGTGFTVGGSVGYSHDWSKAIADSSGFNNATAHTSTNTYGLTPASGTYGFMSFTGTFNCSTKVTTCDGVDFEAESCVPITTSDGFAEGDFMWVTVG